jgi:hypothetical protein
MTHCLFVALNVVVASLCGWYACSITTSLCLNYCQAVFCTSCLLLAATVTTNGDTIDADSTGVPTIYMARISILPISTYMLVQISIYLFKSSAIGNSVPMCSFRAAQSCTPRHCVPPAECLLACTTPMYMSASVQLTTCWPVAYSNCWYVLRFLANQA